MEIWSLIVHVCVSLSLSLYLSLCILMIKRAQTAAGEPSPTRGSCGEVPYLAEEGAGGLIKSLGNNKKKTSAAQKDSSEREEALI